MYSISAIRYFGGLPSSVRVGPIDYAVILESKPTAMDGDSEITVFGKVSFARCAITIDSDLHPMMQWQCLFHEIVHIINEQLGLRQDEAITDGFAYKLLEVLTTNSFLQFPMQETSLADGD